MRQKKSGFTNLITEKHPFWLSLKLQNLFPGIRCYLQDCVEYFCFSAVTSFIALFIDFSSDKSFISSVALTSLSPDISSTRQLRVYFTSIKHYIFTNNFKSWNNLHPIRLIDYMSSPLQQEAISLRMHLSWVASILKASSSRAVVSKQAPAMSSILFWIC